MSRRSWSLEWEAHRPHIVHIYYLLYHPSFCLLLACDISPKKVIYTKTLDSVFRGCMLCPFFTSRLFFSIHCSLLFHLFHSHLSLTANLDGSIKDLQHCRRTIKVNEDNDKIFNKKSKRFCIENQGVNWFQWFLWLKERAEVEHCWSNYFYCCHKNVVWSLEALNILNVSQAISCH